VGDHYARLDPHETIPPGGGAGEQRLPRAYGPRRRRHGVGQVGGDLARNSGRDFYFFVLLLIFLYVLYFNYARVGWEGER
jgi:hypothetical protein